MLIKKKILINIGLTIVSSLLALLLIEVLLRIFPIGQRVKGDHIKLPINKDYSAKNLLITKVDDFIVHKKNSLGFRGKNPNNQDDLKIITIGGSTTECNYISEGKTWTDILGSLLERDFNKLWWNNAGLDGHSTFGHCILLKSYIIKLKPKVVIFLVGNNDQGLEYISKYDLENIRDGLDFRSASRLFKSLAQYSEVASLGLNIYRYLRAVKAKYNDHEVNYEVELRNWKRMDAENYAAEIIRHKKKCLPGYESRIQYLIELSKENGIIPIFVTQPVLYGNFKDENTGLNFENTSQAYQILELYNDVLRKCCSSEKVMLIDMAHKMPKNSLYYYDWIHYTNEGCRKFAEILYASLSPYLADRFPSYLKNYRSSHSLGE